MGSSVFWVVQRSRSQTHDYRPLRGNRGYQSRSEFNSHRKLDYAGSVHLAGNFPEIRVGDVGVDSSKPDVIENIEHVTLKTQPQILADWEIAAYSCILVDHAWLAKPQSAGGRRIPESKRSRRGESGPIDVRRGRRSISDVSISPVAVDAHWAREGRIVIGKQLPVRGALQAPAMVPSGTPDWRRVIPETLQPL